MNSRVKFVFLLFVVLTVGMLTSCKGGESAEETFTFREDTVFAINGEEVSIGEWNLYAQPIIEGVDNLYGDGIWDIKMDDDGMMFSDALKNDVKKRIVNVKLIASKADSLGVSLSEDDKTEITISAEDYMERLDAGTIKKYGITEELVEKVYSDNLLATKVYEHLTLNVDTNTDETEVRHMVLQYIMLPKSYETREGETAVYSDEEMQVKKAKLEAVKKRLEENPKLTMKDVETEELVVTEIKADYAELKERLPEEDAGVVFWLRQNEMSPLIETEEALFLFECESVLDEESTNAARVKVIEEREQQVFGTAYAEWKKDVEVKVNDEVWKTLK